MARTRTRLSAGPHCVTIPYANDKKIDVAPCVVNRGGITRLEVCNRNANAFRADGAEKVHRLAYRAERLLGQQQLPWKVTRLVKYLSRYKKGASRAHRFLLTTLLGYRIDASD